MKKYSVVLLDLGGVVFQSTGVSNEQIDWEIISSLNNKFGHDLNIGMGIFSKFMKEYNALTNQELSGGDFLRLVFDTLEINSDLIEMLKSTSEIIIVSDHYREAIAYISERFHFDNWAVQQIYSYEYKMVKANPLFFQKLLKEVSYSKEEMIFIDDSPSKLESAKKSGIRGLHYQNNEQIKEALLRLNN